MQEQLDALISKVAPSGKPMDDRLPISILNRRLIVGIDEEAVRFCLFVWCLLYSFFYVIN